MRERQLRGAYRDIFDFARRIEDERVNKRVVESLIMAGAFDGLGAHRAQVMAVYIAALESASHVRKKTVAGQLSLFDALDGGPSLQAQAPDYPDKPPFPLKELLAMEKEVTGVYITGHPLDEYIASLERMDFTVQQVMELAEAHDGGYQYDGWRVRMGGLLAQVRSKATKSNALMGFITLEDLTGQIEGLVFPRIWERLGARLTPDAPVIVTGTLSIREEEAPVLRVEEVIPLPKDSALEPAGTAAPQKAQRTPEKLCLRVRDTDQMRAALKIIAGAPGTTDVLFRVLSDGSCLRAPQGYRCRADAALLNALEGLLGEGNAKTI